MKRILPPFVTLLFLGLLGCASAGSYMMVVPVSGGVNVNVLLTKNGPQNAEDDDVKVLYGGFMIPSEKKVGYTFVFEMKSKAVPTKVRIENVNEAVPELILEDTAPKLGPTRHWQGNIILDGDIEGNMMWLNHDTNDMRIFRITITFADGRSSVLHEPSSVPSFIKPMLKEKLTGIKPGDKPAK